MYDPGQHDYQGACMVAAFLVNRDDPLVAVFAGDRGPLTELLKSICALYPLRCPRCSTGITTASEGETRDGVGGTG